ncbi:DUF7024 domain-containing protein [Mesorhizobium sp. 113-3-9]|uniref:DUF7024 domain-containing protein n=1 Tax=Mesorhizobium sp. 113-3-9 TaxID=2744517 RepID=UPI0019274B1C|nr:hypothetical protein [Mesorhizobium sp. 113-3-9]
MILAYDKVARFSSITWTNSIQLYRNNSTAFLSVFLVSIGIAISIRNQGLYAVVFADEYIYSNFSRLSAIAGAPVPSYLFFSIYKYTSFCGDGFLACARYLNTIFFILAVPFIFSISSRITSKPVATLISILSVLAPINTYTAYYMPESLYYLCFWFFSWGILSLDNNSRYLKFILVALIFSLTTLVKPHSLFFLPGVVLYFAYLIRQRPEQNWIARWLQVSTLFVAVAIAAKMALGFALAGSAGITLFGPVYGSIAGRAATHYVDLIKVAGFSLAGHSLALSILFGTPLATVLFSLRKALSRNEAGNAPLNIAFYAFAIFATLIPIVALFTASVATGAGGGDTPFRLHMRYYNFAFPLLLMAIAGSLQSAENRKITAYSSILFASMLILGIICISTRIIPYTPSYIDSPEIRGLTYNKYYFYILSAISTISLIFWLKNRRTGAIIFLFIFTPLSVVFTSYFSSLELRNRLHPDAFDEAGIFAHQYLAGSDASRLAAMGSSPAGLFRALFYLDNPRASIAQIPAGAPADLSKVPRDKEWLLLIGDHPPPPSFRFKLDLNGFSIFRLAGSDRIDFTRRSWPEILTRAQGLSFIEAWGRWSDGPMVTLEFVKPLPKKFVLHLTANAFGPNVGRPISVHTGSQSATFVLSRSAQEIAIPFENSEASTSISISIPNPISPKELGLNQDRRKLGIAFRQMSVEDLTQ